MLRSLYSGVAGLKTHQTKMDVIGNNIANVNTVAYKSQSITFSELMYQTTQAASGPNAATGTAGTNAKQIGLGVTSGAISTAIATTGATQTTGNPFDIKITGDSFFVVSDGNNTYFTRDGSFYVDAAGNLAMSSSGYNVMGWGADPDTQTIVQDSVKQLRIMSPENMTYPPEATTKAYVSGILDKNDSNVTSASGKTVSVSIYDDLGYNYTAKFAIKNTETEGQYTVELDDIMNSDNKSLKDVYDVTNISDIVSFGEDKVLEETNLYQLAEGVKYDGTNYTKECSFPDIFSDYESNKVNGITYTYPGTADATIPADTTVTLNGSGTVAKDDLIEAYNLIYSGGKYYKNGTEIAPDAWAGVLNKGALGSFTATVDGEGNVNFSFTQDFTTDAATVYTASTEIFTKTIADQAEAYGLDTSNKNVTYTYDVAPDGQAQITKRTALRGNTLIYSTEDGSFDKLANANPFTLDFKEETENNIGVNVDLKHFKDVSIDFSSSSMYNNNTVSTIGMVAGDKEGLGCGRKLGELSGVSIQNNGMIYASYDNGQTRLLGQIAVANFANASGLQKEGDNLYSSTLNSGEFDGIGVDITAGGGYMSTGVLEMSNVDLSSEFTEMITTQRGFQANSRIITTSDSLLEELVNLKR